jgi:hypothetical protein
MAGLLDYKPPPRGLLDAQHIAKYGDGSTLSSYTPTMREKFIDWLAQNWYGDNREGTRQAENLSNVLETVTPYGMATMAYDAGRAGGSGDYLGAGLMGAMAALPLPAPVEKKAAQGIRAFHGSPHSFDKFDLSKIGTGEGAQAYGHGLYFAENEGVAKGYRDQLSGLPTLDGNSSIFAGLPWTSRNTEKLAREALQNATKNGLSGDDAVRDAVANLSKQGDMASASHVRQSSYDAANTIGSLLGKKWDVSPGSMYEVRINANPDDFLDWDKPLSEQPEAIRRKIGWTAEQEAAYRSASGADADALLAALYGDPNQYTPTKMPVPKGLPSLSATGADIVKGNSVFDSAADVTKSRALAEKGIPGIKYLDAGSRGKGDGSRNYVVFDDKLIEIVRKYGIAGATALVGYNFMPELTAEQQKQLKMIEG